MHTVKLALISNCCCNLALRCANFGTKSMQHTINKRLKNRSSLIESCPFGKIPNNKFFKMNYSSVETTVFKGVKDRYQGITVSSKEEPCEIYNFASTLVESLSKWKSNQVRGVWFKIFLDNAEWVPILAQNGFKFHHAESEYVMMCKWLPENEECNIPRYAHTMVGVGAIVVNSKEELLVVKEKYHEKPLWKLPGGYVEPGEDLVDAAIREVAEETSVKTKFSTIVAYRHTQLGMQFGLADIYFIVSLIPLSDEIVKSDQEIVDCKWMKVRDFLSHHHVHRTNKEFVTTFLTYRASGLQISYVKNTHPTLNRLQCIYSASLSSTRISEDDATRSDIPQDNLTDRKSAVDSQSGCSTW